MAFLVFESYVTDPFTVVAPFFTVKVTVFIDDMAITSLNVAVISMVTGTFAAPSDGLVAVMVGGDMSLPT